MKCLGKRRHQERARSRNRAATTTFGPVLDSEGEAMVPNEARGALRLYGPVCATALGTPARHNHPSKNSGPSRELRPDTTVPSAKCSANIAALGQALQFPDAGGAGACGRFWGAEFQLRRVPGPMRCCCIFCAHRRPTAEPGNVAKRRGRAVHCALSSKIAGRFVFSTVAVLELYTVYCAIDLDHFITGPVYETGNYVGGFARGRCTPSGSWSELPR